MKVLQRTLVAIALVATASGCDTTRGLIMSQHSSSPRPVQLGPDVRKQLARQFDVAALEELLGTMPVDEQTWVLTSFGVGHDSDSQAETKEVSIMVWSSDPARQALLDRVWAPFWDTLPSEYLDRTDLPYPGRELARARRTSESADRARKTEP